MDPERHGITPNAVLDATMAAVQRLMRLDYARTIGNAVTTITAAQVPGHQGALHCGVRKFKAFLCVWPFCFFILELVPLASVFFGS